MNALCLSVVLTALSGAVPPETVVKADRPDPLPAGAVARLGTTRFRVGEMLRKAVLSPDGKFIALVVSGKLVLMDAATGKQRSGPDASYVVQMAFAPDGRTLATANLRGMVGLWEIPSGRPRGQFATKAQPRAFGVGGGLLFSQDGKFLAFSTGSFGRQGSVFVWQLAGGKEVAKITPLQQGTVQPLLSKDGKLLVTYPEGRTFQRGQASQRIVQLWDVIKGKELRRITVPASGPLARLDKISAAALTPDGKLLTVRSLDKVWIIDTATGKEKRHLEVQPFFSQSQLAFSPDGKLLIEMGGPNLLLWDTATWKRTETHREGPFGRSVGLAFLPKGRILTCDRTQNALLLWDVKSGKILIPQTGHENPVKAMAFPAGGKGLFSAAFLEDAVLRWDITTGKELGQVRFFPQRMAVRQVALSPDGRYAAARADFEKESVLRIMDLSSGKQLRDLKGPEDFLGPSKLTFSPDARLLAECISLEKLQLPIRDVSTGKTLRQITLGEAAREFGKLDLVFSPDSILLAIANRGPTQQRARNSYQIDLWQIPTGKKLWSTKEPAIYAVPLAFLSDGKMLASGGEKGIILRELTKGKELRRFDLEDVIALAFSSDGRTLAGASAKPEDGTYTVQVWELATGGLRRRFSGHSGKVSCLRFAPDGKLLASGSDDTTILLWDVTGRFLAAGQPSRKAEKLWTALNSADAAQAFLAMGQMTAHPAQAVNLFRARLKPAEGEAPRRAEINKLIDELDSGKFAARERANRELKRLGEAAASVLRERLRKDIGLELRRHIEKLLEPLDRGLVPSDQLRGVRAVEVLEHLGTPEARQLLKTLAGGRPGATLTRAAGAALARLRAGG
jgi:WD40 repeat protein